MSMKKLVKVEKVDGEGLMALLGEPVVIFCMNYIYAGKLTGINSTCIQLEEGGIIYETGDFSNKTWKNFQKIGTLYVQMNAIESFAKGK